MKSSAITGPDGFEAERQFQARAPSLGVDLSPGGVDVHDSREFATRKVSDRLLATHPEAQSLHGEAGHRHALAEQSAALVTRAFTAMQETRLGYEELRRRLDPRRTRTVHFGVALAFQAAIFVVLVGLDAVEFTGVLAGWMTAVAIAAAAFWWGCAWLVALTVREGRRGLLAAVIAAAASLGVLLAALHTDAVVPDQADVRYRLGVGIGVVLLILVQAAVASVLIGRTEPASLLLARRRWHRSRSEHAAALRTHRSDVEAAIIARQGWQNLIEMQANGPLPPAARVPLPRSGSG
jgi:hypothetical protein